MAIAFVQRNQDGNATGLIELSASNGDADVTAGNTLLLAVNVSNAVDGTVTGVTDSEGNTWALDVGPVSISNRNHYLWRASNVAAGGTVVTVAVSGTPDSVHLILAEYSGLATSNPLDRSTSATGTSASPSSGATATTTQANELVFGAFMSATGETFTPGSGFTNRTEHPGVRVHAEDMIVSATGAQTADGTFVGSVGWAAICATYKELVLGTDIAVPAGALAFAGLAPVSSVVDPNANDALLVIRRAAE